MDSTNVAVIKKEVPSPRTEAQRNKIPSLTTSLDRVIRSNLKYHKHYAFSTICTDAPNPCLNISGIGTVGLPLSERDAKLIIEQSRRVLCKSVGAAASAPWEIGAANVKYDNPGWEQFLSCMVKETVCPALGVGKLESSPRYQLDKLLLYETGSRKMHSRMVEDQKFARFVATYANAYSGNLSAILTVADCALTWKDFELWKIAMEKSTNGREGSFEDVVDRLYALISKLEFVKAIIGHARDDKEKELLWKWGKDRIVEFGIQYIKNFGVRSYEKSIAFAGHCFNVAFVKSLIANRESIILANAKLPEHVPQYTVNEARFKEVIEKHLNCIPLALCPPLQYCDLHDVVARRVAIKCISEVVELCALTGREDICHSILSLAPTPHPMELYFSTYYIPLILQLSHVKVTKVAKVLAAARWEGQLADAKKFLNMVGTDEQIEKFMGDRYEDLMKALEGNESFVLDEEGRAAEPARTVEL
ncbi:hypothetical protein AX17_005684 [Amanita inopinata Kibby_2008]|nr:hypothetical protein AX17_005684 [Amanita inopinata Kibby_2008]